MPSADTYNPAAGGDWRQNLSGPVGFIGGGSFRGVNFFVKSAKSTVGRKVAIHEFPGADVGSADDLGQRVRRYRLEAYVLGGGYMAQRDKLTKEFETAGPGLLVHPFWGRFVVTVDSPVEIEEAWEEGGGAKFTLSVAQVGVLALSFQTIDTFGTTLGAAGGLLTAAQAAFASAFTVVSALGSIAQDAANVVNGVVQTISSVKGQINAVMQAIDTVASSIQSLAAGVASLILLPSSLASQFSSIVTATLNSVSTIGAAWGTYFNTGESAGSTAAPSLAPMLGTPAGADVRAAFLLACASNITTPLNALPAVTATDAAGIQIAANRAALQQFIGCCVTAAVCQTAASLPYGSSDSAVAMRTAIVAQIDALCLTSQDDASYAALCALRDGIYQQLTVTATSLPNVISYTHPISMHALVLAQHLYGAPDLAEDIIFRNNTPNPCLITGPLKVLNG